MKKKLLCFSIAAIAAFSLFGCGQKAKDGMEAVNPDNYVTLGDYKNLDVTVDYVDYTEDELKAYINQDLEYYVSSYDLYDYKPIKSKKTVSENDVANIDYVGKKDGVAFDGGTADGAHLEIGSGTFIPGFEDGLIGVAVGDTVDLDLTFPENYGNEELAGQQVVFTVTVNSVDERIAPKYDADFFVSFGIDGVDSFDTYLNYARGFIDDAKNEQNNTSVKDAIWNAVVAKCEVKEIPQDILDTKMTELEADLQEYADAYGVDKETMIGYMGYDTESYEAQKKVAAEEEARSSLIALAIAKAEGVEVTDEDLKEVAEKEYADYGYNSAEEMLNAKTDEYMRNYIRKNKVIEVLRGYAKITEGKTESMLAGYIEESEE